MPPNVPLDLLDRIRALEDQVRQLAGRANIRPALNQVQGGDVIVSNGGRLKVQTPDGVNSLFVGRVTPDHPDGTPQYGVFMYREDGSLAFNLCTGTGAGPQVLALYDASGNTILADDVNSAQGLANPYIGASGWFGATEQPAFTTTSSTFSTVMHLPWVKQHPRVTAYYLARCSDGTTAGEARLVDDSGMQIGPTVSLPAGSFTFGSIVGPLAGAHEFQTYLHWQVRRTAGTGTVGIRGLSTFGVQS